jgi:Gpi18-like mannosyltransferase
MLASQKPAPPTPFWSSFLQALRQREILFPVAMFLSSRLVLCIGLLIIAPLMPTPTANGSEAATFSLDVFHAWDSIWYERIVRYGYEFVNDGKQYSIAFFPLYPILSGLLTKLGFSFAGASILVNNISFLAALLMLFRWMQQRYDTKVAHWATAVLAWCPYSLYCSVIYTEGVFFLCTIAALWSFEDKNYGRAAFWGTLATAARLPGATLIPAFLAATIFEKRGRSAFVTSLIIGMGLVAFSLFCWWRFGDALAFLTVQRGWRNSVGFNTTRWGWVLYWITMGIPGWHDWKTVIHPYVFAALTAGSTALWWFRQKLPATLVGCLWAMLWFILWWFTGEAWIKVTVVFGGLYLVLRYWRRMPLSLLVYTACTYFIIFNTGLTASTERYAYGIITVPIALGLFLSQFPYLGVPMMVVGAWILGWLGVLFAQDLWVA